MLALGGVWGARSHGAARPGAALVRPKAVNPHWKREACDQCHAMQAGKAQPIAPEKVDEVCVKCHDGRQAAVEFHPVGGALDPARFTHPKDWPVVDNRLICTTCHDVKMTCGETVVRVAANRMFLREYQSGRSQSKPFCQNCHQEAAYKKLNPHVMVLGEKDEIIEDKCLFCHNRPLDRKAMTRTGDSALKAEQAKLCRDCHTQHKDPMQQEHVGIKVSPTTEARIFARETMGFNGRLSDASLEKIVKAGQKPTRMVPGKDGTILCSTCHNPHEKGVFPPGSVLSYRAMWIKGDGQTISPVRGQAWCRHCHEF